MGFWVLVVLFLLLLAAGPWWPYSRSWGYWPGGFILGLLILWLALLWMGMVLFYWPWGAPSAVPVTP